MKKIFLTGASGLLGANLMKIGSADYQMYGVYNQHKIDFDNCWCAQLDLTSEGETEKMIGKVKPDLIIHCAALTDVEYCETYPVEAEAINVGITKNLSRIAKKLAIKFIYISTDSVFNGKKGDYTEDDTPDPLNVYAQTKLKGEKVIQSELNNYLIVRTNIYGWNYQNKMSLAEWILTKLKRKERITMFTDVYFTPVLVNDLTKVLFKMYENNIIGTFHVTGREKCSKYDFGIRLASVFGLDSKNIEPISVDNFSFKAKRPKDMSLNTSKVSQLINNRLPNIEQGLNLFKELSNSDYLKELKGKFFSKDST